MVIVLIALLGVEYGAAWLMGNRSYAYGDRESRMLYGLHPRVLLLAGIVAFGALTGIGLMGGHWGWWVGAAFVLLLGVIKGNRYAFNGVVLVTAWCLGSTNPNRTSSLADTLILARRTIRRRITGEDRTLEDAREYVRMSEETDAAKASGVDLGYWDTRELRQRLRSLPPL